MTSKSTKNIKNGDLVRTVRQQVQKYGIVVSSLPSNSYPSKHIENVVESYPNHYYVLFDKSIEGPFLPSELDKVN